MISYKNVQQTMIIFTRYSINTSFDRVANPFISVVSSLRTTVNSAAMCLSDNVFKIIRFDTKVLKKEKK